MGVPWSRDRLTGSDWTLISCWFVLILPFPSLFRTQRILKSPPVVRNNSTGKVIAVFSEVRHVFSEITANCKEGGVLMPLLINSFHSVLGFASRETRQLCYHHVRRGHSGHLLVSERMSLPLGLHSTQLTAVTRVYSRQ